MKNVYAAICLLLTAVLGHAQQLSVSFAQLDGKVHPLTAIPALQSGHFVGTLELEQLREDPIYLAWAYYHGGQIACVPTGSSQFAFADSRPIYRNKHSVVASEASDFSVKLPYGHRDGYINSPALPIGEYTLSLWVLDEPAQAVVPPSQYVCRLDFQVAVSDFDFVVWLDNDTNVHVEDVINACVIVGVIEEFDRFFTIKASGGFATATESVMVPGGMTSSPLFAVTALALGAGDVMARDAFGEERHSPGSLIRYSATVVEVGDGPGDIPGQKCKAPTIPDPLGGETTPCGRCYDPLTTANGPVDPRCDMFAGQIGVVKHFCHKYECVQGTIGQICKVIPVTLTFKDWELDRAVWIQDCASVVTTTSSNGGWTGGVGLPTVGGQVTNNSTSHTVISRTMKQKCCQIKCTGTSSVPTASCQ